MPQRVLSGRPLIDRERDADLFCDREDVLTRLASAASREQHYLVHGPDGIGRTSTLRQLLRRLRHDGHLSRWVPTAGIEEMIPAPPARSSSSFFETYASLWKQAHPTEEEIQRQQLQHERGRTRALTELINAVHDQLTDAPWNPSDDPATALNSLAHTSSKLSELHTIVIDDVPPEVGNLLFGTWRDRVWDMEKLIWIIGVHSNARHTVLQGPAEAFFEVIELKPLTEQASQDLLRRRGVDLPADVLGSVVELGRGNPRKLLDVARGVLEDDLEGQDLAAFNQWQQTILEGLGRPAAMLLAELSSTEWTSASDPGLQRRMGWSRGRLSQVLRQLRDAELVLTSSQPTGGRPLITYRAAAAADTRNRAQAPA